MGTYEQTMLKLEKMAQANTATQMNWQEKMSKTSHQMEVDDLVKAGLNPVLSANQGASSYTTSVDSAVNGIAGMASAREGANATKYAARQAAAATRAAAASQLAAAREAAAASRYAADRHYEAQKYQVENSKSGSFAGILDNFMKGTKSDNTGLGKTMSQLWKNVDKKPHLFFRDKEHMNFKNLNASGRNIIQKTLRNIGIKETLPNQKVAYKALFEHDKNAQLKLASWMKAFNKKANNARMIWSSRTGSGIW